MCNESIWQVNSARACIKARQEYGEIVTLETKDKGNELLACRRKFGDQVAIRIA